jgi:hypothetical protein
VIFFQDYIEKYSLLPIDRWLLVILITVVDVLFVLIDCILASWPPKNKGDDGWRHPPVG